MPVHDWTRVDAGIFHAFHHEWITEIGRALNRGLLPSDYYALPEQQAAGFGPDILTLHRPEPNGSHAEKPPSDGATGLLLAPPRVGFTAETTAELFRRKKSTIVVRHVSGDRVVAVVEILSPGNKGSRHSFESLIDKACELLECKIHLLIVDLFPPTKRDPHGVHASIWEEIASEVFTPPSDKPLTAVAYESGTTVKAYIEPFAVGDRLPIMPLFLESGAHVLIPLETTYQEAFASVPLRWRRVL
jgi:hypothetical protein